MAWIAAFAAASAAANEDDDTGYYNSRYRNSSAAVLIGLLMAFAMGFLLLGINSTGFGFGGESYIIIMLVVMIFLMMIVISLRRMRYYQRNPNIRRSDVRIDNRIITPQYSQSMISNVQFREEVKQELESNYCPYCGTSIENKSSKYCSVCGQKFD